jgi:hypothetical protein
MKIPTEIQENFYEVVKIASDKGQFSDWITELLEWNTIRFFSKEIDEDVWKGTKNLIENRILTINNPNKI